MKYAKDILYLEFSEYVPAIVGEPLYHWQKRKTIRTSGRGGNGNPVLIEWESIPTKYQVKFKKIQCENRCDSCRNNNIDQCDWNIYEYALAAPLKKCLKPDYKAKDFYIKHKFDNGSALKPDHVESYTKAAEWLNLLHDLSNKPAVIKRDFNLSIGQFWKTVCKVLEMDKVDLPTSYKRLRMKLAEYQTESYKCLISGKFGNQNTAKVNDDLSKSVLLDMIAHPHCFDDIAIVKQYNIWATKNGYKSIDAATVGVHRRKTDYLTRYYREGENEYNKHYNINIPGARPSAPLYQINSDDNNLDIFFIDVDSTGGGKYYNKLVLIVVMDVFNDYVLGYSWRIAESPIIEMVHAAYLDAVYQVRKLTGDFHLWHELKADGWAGKTLKPFYEKQGVFIAPRFKNAKAKLIEQAFGGSWHDVLKKVKGYSGHNITSKKRGVNPDYLSVTKKDYHTTEEAGAVAQFIVNELRNLPGKTNKAITREQEWLNGWNTLATENKRKVSDEFILDTFGKQHLVRDKKYPNEITNNGVKVQIEGIKYQYFLNKEIHQQLIGSSVRIVYDGIDMSRVLLTDDQDVRVIAHTIDAIPRAAKDFGTGDRKRHNDFLEMKLYHARKVGDADQERRSILKEAGINTEALLQAGSGQVIKELAKYAESNYELKSIGVHISNQNTVDEDYDDLADM